MTINWKVGEPPRKEGLSYMFITGSSDLPKLVSGSYRPGYFYEPVPNQVYWRADCCGRFIHGIIAWALLPTEKEIWRIKDGR